MYDIVVVGGGPAGLTAAIYARRANKSVLILEKNAFGGQIVFSPKVENYPGFESLSGSELADALVSHALAQGADVEVETVVAIEDLGDKKIVKTTFSILKIVETKGSQVCAWPVDEYAKTITAQADKDALDAHPFL